MIALWVQNALLLVNVAVVWWYVAETIKIRKASEQQTAKSQLLVEAAQEQMESQSRPAVVARFNGTIHLTNIGNGPAIYIELARVAQNAEPDFNLGAIEPGRVVSHLAANNGVDTSIGVNWLAHPEPSLQCRYRSLSGRRYISVIDPRG